MKVAQDLVERASPKEINLFWQNLTFRIPLPQSSSKESQKLQPETRTIVENLTGLARPNKIIGLLGPSASGKTTLLNILSSRLHPPSDSEYLRKVYVNDNIPLTRDLFGKVAAYVMQDDVLLETLTPYECFKFAANLRLSCSEKEKEEAVSKVITALRLQVCKDTLVSLGSECRLGMCCRKGFRGERGSGHL
eukprot:TRINITY_DN7949_c0_g1_i2.p1 TRINITY_DN7949_c0_g1~~TRINITY_DN7949_c0_g1_i2.p1  ORF type:complete len:192 (-),score=23.46 TRINITY_DN7949_c0_g1_i2:622-1197(-)